MSRFLFRTAILMGVFAAGCEPGQDPPLAVPPGPAKPAAPPPPPAPSPARSGTKYQSRTADEWAKDLSDPDLNAVRQAVLALRILGREGRPHLIQGLASSQPETRRLCLEALSPSDLRTLGDDGRMLLVKLAGDPKDLRIRELATRYLREWHQSVPAR